MTVKEHTTHWHRRRTQEKYRKIWNDAIYFIADTHTDVCMKEFCEFYGYSRRSVQRVFSFYGTTWSKYLLAIRMQRACRMLMNTSYTYQEIAKIIGYSDTPQFRRRFKQHYGISPHEYREQTK